MKWERYRGYVWGFERESRLGLVAFAAGEKSYLIAFHSTVFYAGVSRFPRPGEAVTVAFPEGAAFGRDTLLGVWAEPPRTTHALADGSE